MIRFVRYAILLLAGLALIVAWTSVDSDGRERPAVPAIEPSPGERTGAQRTSRTDGEGAEGREARETTTSAGEGAAPAPAPQPAPAGDDELDDAGEAEDGDDGDDGDD
jgi:hypothetical protein